jgi:hypothetical protein
LDESRDRVAAVPVLVAIGTQLVAIEDHQDGTRARRLAELLVREGGTWAEPSDPRRADLRIALRSTPESNEARLRAEVLEETADLVLGSVRPAFARRFVEALSAT